MSGAGQAGGIQIGVGALQTTIGYSPPAIIQSGIRDAVSVLDAIPEIEHASIKAGTSTYDITPVLNELMAELSALGGGEIYFPPGRYRKGGGSTSLLPQSNIRLRGANNKASVFFHDTSTGPNRFLATANPGAGLSYFSMQDIGVEGSRDADLTEGAQCIEIYDGDHLSFVRVAVRKARAMALICHRCDDVLVDACEIREINRDGIRLIDCPNITVTNNKLRFVNDDALALHMSNDEIGIPVRSGMVVTGNQVEDSQGANILGAKILTFSNNTFKRISSYGFTIKGANTGPEGKTPGHSVVIANNVVTDVFLRQESPFLNQEKYYAKISGGLRSAGPLAAAPGEADPATGTIVDFFGTGRGYFYANNVDATVASPSGYNWVIVNNIFARTLPAVAAWSDWGYGDALEAGRAGSFNGAIPEIALNVDGPIFEPSLRNVLFQGNTVATTGNNSIAFRTLSPSIDEDNTFRDFKVLDNTFRDFKQYGIAWVNTTNKAQDVLVRGNLFDGDPRLVNSNRGAGGTWLADTLPVGIWLSSVQGFSVEGNTFRNLVTPYAAGGAGTGKLTRRGNIVRGQPSALFFNVGNKGVGSVPRSGPEFLLVCEDSDPTSATFGQVLNSCVTQANSVPTAGVYVTGHFVANAAPAIAAGKVVLGWYRLTTGSGHVVGTDWTPVYGTTT